MRKLSCILIVLAACGESEMAGGPARSRVEETTCAPDAFTCRGSEIVQCGPDGLTASAETVTACVDPVLSSCRMCGSTPSCVAPGASMSGSIVGVAESPILFEDSGCEDIEASLRYLDGDVLKVLALHVRGTHTVNVSLYLSSETTQKQILPGVEFPLNDAPNSRINISVDGCSNDFAGLYNDLPYRGRVTVMWSSIAPGSEVHIELAGPISCGGEWRDISGDITATISE
jgi:hypothetical protein